MDNKLGSIDIVMSLETDEFKKSVAEVSRDSKEMRKDFRVLDAELKNVERTEESLGSATKKLSSYMERQQNVVKQLENAQHRLAQEGKEGSSAYQRLSDNLRSARIDVERTKTSINRLNHEMNNIHSKKVNVDVGGTGGLKNSLSELGSFAGTGLIVAGLGMVGAKAVEVGEEFRKAQVKMQTSLGLTEREMKDYKKVMGDINQSGLTESVEESADVIVALKQNLGELTDEDMTKFGEQTVALSHILGSDFNETLRSSNQLTNIFGDDTEKTFDMITNAVQKGVNKHQDLLDTINEYSTYFADAGFSSEEFFAILDQGLKNGIMNTDKVADGVKEFQIALNDGRIEKGIKVWSTGTQNLFKQYQEGKVTAKDVFDSMVAEINNVKDKEEKQQKVNATGISQWEDWGTAGFNNMDKVGKKTDEVKGKIQGIVDVEKKHRNGWKRLYNAADSSFFSPVMSKLNAITNRLADDFQTLNDWQKKYDSIRTAPMVSPAGYGKNPYANVGKKPAYQNNTHITQNIYTNGGTQKGVNKANKSLSRKMGQGW